MPDPKNILVIRNDKLGDFMLAWPALSLLKKQYSNATITVLVPRYTAPMAELCPWIDDILIDDQRTSTLSDAQHLATLFRNKNFDAAITLFSELRVGLGLWLARVPIRVSPATKWFQIFYNRKLVQRRSRSLKPEYIYNVDLVKFFISRNGDTPGDLQSPPYLAFDPGETEKLRASFMSLHKIPQTKHLIFIHPGSGGSAANLNLEQYASLVKNLSRDQSMHFVITAGPGEEEIAAKLADAVPDCNHTVHVSEQGLKKHALFISIADMFISGSTGVLHIAGALNIPTVAFYTKRRSATSLRWQTMNTDDSRLAFSPAPELDDEDMSQVDIDDTCNKIREKYFLI